MTLLTFYNGRCLRPNAKKYLPVLNPILNNSSTVLVAYPVSDYPKNSVYVSEVYKEMTQLPQTYVNA